MELAVLTYDGPQSNLITQGLLRRRPSAIRGIVRAVPVARGRRLGSVAAAWRRGLRRSATAATAVERSASA